MTPTAGTLIDGRYTLVDPISDRGCGETWKARATQSRNRLVAVKFLRALPEDANVFPAELARALDALKATQQTGVLSARATNVLATTRYGLWEGRPFLAQDLFEGPSLGVGLDQSRRSGNALPLELLALLFEQIAFALETAHGASPPVVHGTLDATCVLIQRLPRKGFDVRVTDFGLGPYADAPSLADPLSACAVDCRDPSLPAEAAPGIATDVFALGCLLRLMLAAPPPSGRALPARGADRARDDVPRALWDVALRATLERPDERFPSLRALVEAFQEALVAPSDAPSPPDAARPSAPQTLPEALPTASGTASTQPETPNEERPGAVTASTVLLANASFDGGSAAPDGSTMRMAVVEALAQGRRAAALKASIHDTTLFVSLPPERNPWELAEDRAHPQVDAGDVGSAPTMALAHDAPPVVVPASSVSASQARVIPATVVATPPFPALKAASRASSGKEVSSQQSATAPPIPWKRVLAGALLVAALVLAPLLVWLLYSWSHAPR